jgi:16S rRNA (cytosine1402-N4)-methyltransferase
MFCGTAEFVCAPSTVRHIPVLLDEALEALAPGVAKRYLDCTFGGGGHTRALLESSSDAEVVSLDCDPDAGIRAEPLAEEYGERFRFCDLSFQRLDEASSEGEFDGVLFDLGISSFQLAEAEKGFSFRLDAPLDMRLNPRVGQSAADFLETATRESLVRAVREYGEERRWNRVVNAILDARGTGQLQRTVTAAEVVSKAIGAAARKPRMHPATKTFQGIRIAINGELEAIAVALPKAFRALKPGGFLVLIAFHSLEDRIVKRFMRRMAGRPEHRRDSRSIHDRVAYAKLTSTKAVKPTAEEVQRNTRSRSARMRVLQKIAQPEL